MPPGVFFFHLVFLVSFLYRCLSTNPGDQGLCIQNWVTKTTRKWAPQYLFYVRVPEITEIIGVIKKTCERHLSYFRALIGVKQFHALMEYYLVARSNLVTMDYGYKLEL